MCEGTQRAEKAGVNFEKTSIKFVKEGSFLLIIEDKVVTREERGDFTRCNSICPRNKPLLCIVMHL